MQFAAVFACYWLGAIPFSQIIARRTRGLDLRVSGYHNPGAYNVAHLIGPYWGILAGMLDAGKGWAAMWVSQALGLPDPALAAWAAILGHSFSPWLRFRGGKGLSTLTGILFWLAPQAAFVGFCLGFAYLMWQPRQLNPAAVIGMSAVLLLSRRAPYFVTLLRILLGFFMLLAVVYTPRFLRWLRKRFGAARPAS